MHIMNAVAFFLFIFTLIIICHGHGSILQEEHGLRVQNYMQLDLPGVIGPESIAFDCNGKGPYVGVSDGRILRWQGTPIGWTQFAFTSPRRRRNICDGSTNPKREPICGRPLGLKFNPRTCDLYIADAYFGLMRIGPKGGPPQQLVAAAEGVPFRFTNALDIDNNTGVVYFTDSSTVFQRREYLLAVIGGDKTGRLLKYDPRTNKVTVLYKGLAFPNGVALSEDNSFLLVAESTTLQILRFSLHGATVSRTSPEIFARLPRFPDNIKRNGEGEFWVALNSGRGKIQKYVKTAGLVRDGNGSDPSGSEWVLKDPVGFKFDEEGKIVKYLDGLGGKSLESVSEVEEHGGYLYTGSSVQPYVGVIKM